MRPAVCLVLAAMLGLVTSLGAQSPQDSIGIREAALNYIEDWNAANGDRMARALHPEMAKRIMFADTLGNVWIRDMGATELVRGTWTGGGTRTPEAQRLGGAPGGSRSS